LYAEIHTYRLSNYANTLFDNRYYNFSKTPAISTAVPMATVKSINGNPILKKRLNVIRYPFFSANPAATTPALEPISVPFPPQFAPNDNAHQSGL
jgi:hypothetical protein